MASGPSRGSLQEISISLQAPSSACSWREMGHFGSALKVLPVGRTASLLNIRSLLTSLFSEYWRIARARYGLALVAFPLENCVQFIKAASVASEMMVVSATAWSAYMRTA